MICDDVMCVQKHKIWSVLQVIGSYFPFQVVLLTVDQNRKVKQVNLVSWLFLESAGKYRVFTAAAAWGVEWVVR